MQNWLTLEHFTIAAIIFDAIIILYVDWFECSISAEQPWHKRAYAQIDNQIMIVYSGKS